MNRFRKKSDVKRSQLPDFIASSSSTPNTSFSATQSRDSLPELPSTGDFRTSLILPDLSRRFSVLRSTSGVPVSVDDLKSKFAEQRARGAQNHITEEEEDMILDALGRIRTRTSTTTSASTDNVVGVNGEDTDDPKSIRSGASSFITSSPNGRTGKRYSNNLFSSGRRDYSYMRHHGSSSKGSTRTASMTPTESSIVTRDNTNSVVDSLRPVTPDNASSLRSPSASLQSSPNDKSSVRSAPLVPPAPYGELSSSSTSTAAVEYRLAKTFGPSVLQRASMALEEVIKEIEDEVEEEIVMPRTAPVQRGSLDQPRVVLETKESDTSTSTSSTTTSTPSTSTPSMYEAAIAISHDKHPPTTLEERRASPIPARILPGYIPGMPRPMTPRDLDADEQRSHSTTPRATSPIHSSFGFESNSLNKPRRGSVSSTRQSPRPTTPVSPSAPLFLQRSTNGRYTPEDSGHYKSDPVEFDSPLNSSLLARRRPASPLAGSSYQPLAAATTSRPSTPSNIIWNPGRNTGNKPLPQGGHSRNGSWISDGGKSDAQSSPERSKAQPNIAGTAVITPQPASTPPSLNLESSTGSPSRSTRSPTPTHPGTSSRRSSKQTAPSSPFNLFNFSMPILSPIANSSRTSLDSTGSSFHSYDDNKDPLANLFGESDVQQPAWYDVSYSDKSSSTTLGGGGGVTDDEYDAEDIIMRYGGLKKADFIAIQDKLVKVAVARDANPDARDRAPSAMRKRRPSTSQSNYSSGGRPERIASPPPGTQPTSPASPTFPTPAQTSTPDQSKLLLLNSIVNSIQSTREPSVSIKTDVPAAISDPSPNTRRNRDLAHVLFGNGSDDERDGKTPKPEQQQRAQQERENQQQQEPKKQIPQQEQQQKQQAQSQQQEQMAAKDMPQTTPLSSGSIRRPDTHESKPQPVPALQRNTSSQKPSSNAKNDADLERRVQQQAEAAMARLGKRPSNGNLRADGLAHSSSIRKRISPNQISEPRLVSATTSVDTIPLRSPSLTSGNSSKLGSRFKIFRGARTKHSSTTEEPAADPRTPPANQTIHYDPVKLKTPGAPSLSSGYKVPIPSPPASAGPGLRGFMARFRNKRGGEVSAESEYRASPQPRRSDSPLVHTTLPQTVSESPVQLCDVVNNPSRSNPHESRLDIAQEESPSVSVPLAPVSQSAGTASNDNESALKQLFDAAGSLGLDQGALTALLARSGSVSRATDWAPNGSTSPAGTPRPDAAAFTFGGPSPSVQESADETQNSNNPSVIYPSRSLNGTPSEFQDSSPNGKPSTRGAADATRRPREKLSEVAADSVVRRTIIYASDAGVDLNALMRKQTSRRRRASGMSELSGRSDSVKERVPTPPPPKSKRFSSDTHSPPVPQLPHALGQLDNHLNVPSSSAVEKSNSAYDSLYEMYAGESRGVGSVAPDSNASGNYSLPDGGISPSAELGPALELVEYANGETIWKVVNGLRDDDDESLYNGRTSFASEYSTRESNVEGLQVFVKEHTRSGSKGSNASFLSRKRASQGKTRPETKVFHTTAAQMARLLDSLSQQMDAGSINIIPSPTHGATTSGHSASSSLSITDSNWTIEERLEHMLSSIRKS
ncbi:hypothetical protein BDQ17DRAFT_1322984 [Cyathus striatus]|nr:hypothetical protein BDQ17DRAFT_1322984 [Cyathus striatus]